MLSSDADGPRVPQAQQGYSLLLQRHSLGQRVQRNREPASALQTQLLSPQWLTFIEHQTEGFPQ